MPSDPVIDFEALLKPISDESPSGVDIREHAEVSGHYSAIREYVTTSMTSERELARQALTTKEDLDRDRSGEQPISPPVWNKVVQLANELLSTTTKDLWIVAWLIQALTREGAIAGVRDGFKVCTEMSEAFWDTIHPRPDPDEGLEHTVSLLSRLDETLPAVMDATPIFREDRNLTWANYQWALKLEELDSATRAHEIEDGKIPLSAFQSEISRASREELLQVHEDLVAARSECERFSEVMQSLCGKNKSGMLIGPSTRKIQEKLESLQKSFAEMTRGLLQDETASPSEGDETALSESSGGPATAVGVAQRPVASRDEALQHLLRVADFFRKTEPHSPVSYALEQAVRWGKMPLPDLLKDLVSDSEVLAQMYKRMGIEPPTT